jgi:diguanylate cyclase (GGDEF)-like protein/PAS domain S-box-containing protein
LIHSHAWILALAVPLLYVALHTYRAHNESVRTERREVLDLLEAAQRSEQRYALAAAGSNDGLWDWDIAGGSLYCSDRWKAMLGLRADESVVRLEQWLRHVVEEDREALRSALNAHLLASTSHLACEYRIRHRNGEVRDMLCRGMAVRDDLGHAVRMAGSQTDVTESRRIHHDLAQAARLDPLTGLPNRTHFGEIAQRQIAQSRRTPGSAYAVLFIDLNEFKLVNDSLGHVSGDELLIGIARRLTASLREGDMLARLGGDEFAVLATNVSGADEASRVAERLQRALAEPFKLTLQEVYASASIGIVVGNPDYATVAELLTDADAAMYRAKASGRGVSALFDATLRAQRQQAGTGWRSRYPTAGCSAGQVDMSRSVRETEAIERSA